MKDDEGYDYCIIKGKFGMVRELYVNIRLFTDLLKHLASNYVKQVEWQGFGTSDISIDNVNNLLGDIECKELVIVEWCTVTTRQVANMLANCHIDNVVIRCRNVDISELRNFHPHITFTQWDSSI